MNMMRSQIYLSGVSETSRLASHVIAESLVLTDLPIARCIAVDGGVAEVLNVMPQAQEMYFVGDQDSVSQRNLATLEKKSSLKKVVLSPEKNYSDFGAALDLLTVEQCAHFVEVFCGFGGRRDHELINILEAESFVKNMQSPVILVFEPSLIITNTSLSLHGLQGHIFSIVKASVPLTIRGAKYSGVISLQRPSHGLSNVVVDGILDFEMLEVGIAWIVF